MLPYVLGIEEGWTHQTAHLGLTLTWKGVVIAPSLNDQWSNEPSMNPEDEFWFSLMLGRRF